MRRGKLSPSLIAAQRWICGEATLWGTVSRSSGFVAAQVKEPDAENRRHVTAARRYDLFSVFWEQEVLLCCSFGEHSPKSSCSRLSTSLKSSIKSLPSCRFLAMAEVRFPAAAEQVARKHLHVEASCLLILQRESDTRGGG